MVNYINYRDNIWEYCVAQCLRIYFLKKNKIMFIGCFNFLQPDFQNIEFRMPPKGGKHPLKSFFKILVGVSSNQKLDFWGWGDWYLSNRGRSIKFFESLHIKKSPLLFPITVSITATNHNHLTIQIIWYKGEGAPTFICISRLYSILKLNYTQHTKYFQQLS